MARRLPISCRTSERPSQGESPEPPIVGIAQTDGVAVSTAHRSVTLLTTWGPRRADRPARRRHPAHFADGRSSGSDTARSRAVISPASVVATRVVGVHGTGDQFGWGQQRRTGADPLTFL